MPAAEENAKRLMKALVCSGLSAGLPIANARIDTIGIGIGVDGDALDQALEFAASHGWLDVELDRPHHSVLTEAGVAVVKA
jgi:hypothetical protein